jgi:hypothetical protein
MDRRKLVQALYELLLKEPLPKETVLEKLAATEQEKDFLMAMFEALRAEGYLKFENGVWLAISNENANDYFDTTFGNIGNIPAATIEYLEQYAFSVLVAKVSRWVNHDNVLDRHYDEDRLWVGRYIDFLDKAREWQKWQDADVAIAKEKAKQIKNSYKNDAKN